MIVEADYYGFRIEVNAVAAGDRWNAEVRISRTLSQDNPHVEVVTNYKLRADLAERSAMTWARRWVDSQELRGVMALYQRKVSLISEFLEESFVGCSVYDYEDKRRVAHSYRVISDTTGKVLRHVFVTRAFLNDHAEVEVVPALQNLGLLVCLGMAGGRRVIVRNHMIEIEEGA